MLCKKKGHGKHEPYMMFQPFFLGTLILEDSIAPLGQTRTHR